MAAFRLHRVSTDEACGSLSKSDLPFTETDRSGWIDAGRLPALAQPLLTSGYGQYLQQVLKDKVC